MIRNLSFVSVAALALLVSTSTANAAATFTLGFDGCPTAPIEGKAGDPVALDIFATLETTGNDSADGPQGWSLSIAIDGAELAATTSVTVKGVIVETLYDEDEDPATPLASVPLDLGTADFKVAQRATGDYPDSTIPGKKGAVSAIVLNNTIKRVLRPNAKDRVLKLSLSTTIPAEEAGKEVVVTFLDKLQGAGKPVSNVVTFNGASNTPVKTECRFKVMPKAAPKPGFNLAVIPQGKSVTDLPVEGPNAVYATALAVGEQELKLFVNHASELLDPNGDGPQGWSLSVASEACATVPTNASVTVKGVIVQTLYNQDEDPATPLEDVPLDLGTADFKVAQRANGDYEGSQIPGVQGVVSAIVLNNTIKRVLKPNASDNILSITVKVNVVAGVNPDCKLYFVDGLQGAGKPVSNVITFNGASNKPKVLQGLILRLTGQTEAPKGRFIRGDANNDSRVDIADVVWTVYAVVPGLGGAPTVCRDAGDSNDDELMDLVDAVYTINWQFKGGPKPPEPGGATQRTCGTDDDSTAASCPAASTSCPAA